MKFKCPKGILILVLFVLFANIISIKHIFYAQGKLVFCNFILQGELLRLYYILTISINIFISIGLLFLKRWAYVIFMLQNFFFILLSICNILFIEKSTLILAGWKDYEQLLSGYKFVMCFAILISITLIIWIASYRKYFLNDKLIASQLNPAKKK